MERGFSGCSSLPPTAAADLDSAKRWRRRAALTHWLRLRPRLRFGLRKRQRLPATAAVLPPRLARATHGGKWLARKAPPRRRARSGRGIGRGHRRENGVQPLRRQTWAAQSLAQRRLLRLWLPRTKAALA